MDANENLAKIPVQVYTPTRKNTLKWGRTFSQLGILVALILIPALGIFRIDLSAGFVILDRQVWFSDFLLVFGFWLSAACTLILMYSSVGTAFCGWVCPQNTLSSLANKWTFNAFGKRAVIDWESSDKSKINDRKNNLLNWSVLFLKLLAASLLLAIIPLFYFHEPQAMWSFLLFQENEKLAASSHWIYFVFVVIAFVNLAVVRHFACRYMCIYRMWQYLFKTKDTLHIDYDQTRSKDCEKCNYCSTSCMVEIDPRHTSTFDSCTNCGACIVACDTMHQKKEELGLLKFKFGPRKNAFQDEGTRSMGTLGRRVGWVMPVWLLGVSMFVWGIVSYDPHHVSVYKQSISSKGVTESYRINLASKYYSPSELKVDVGGL
ncbi:MAG: 4Fe-4S binding protein, partial [Gammaproteobacteria bacterium]|nr:4Fe-4S binding protein [Gammaproteobacteria bacterium]